MTDPLPLLLPYQCDWVIDRSAVKVCCKSRQIGITYATAYEAVEVAALAASEGGSDFWYQCYDEDTTKEFIEDAAKWARAAEIAFETDVETYTGEQANEHFLLAGNDAVNVFTIRFRSGHKIAGLSHQPRKIRSRNGVYCLDEASYHDDLQGAIEAAGAFGVWGGRTIIISSMGDVDHAFAKLVDDIEVGRGIRAGYSLHKITMPEAVEQGLYRQICAVKLRIPWTAEGEREWLAERLAEEGAETEYLCVPRRSGGQYLPRAVVEPCTDRAHSVVRFVAPETFMQVDEAERDEQIDAWCTAVLEPLLAKLPQDKPHFLGEDFGRSSDLTVLAIGYLDQQLRLVVPFMVELGNVPYESQRRVLFYIARRLPRLTRMVFDRTGNGAYLAEQALLHWGDKVVDGVHMNVPWYAETMPKLRARFHDKAISIPADLDVLEDLGKFEVVDGVPRLPKQRIAAVRIEQRRKGTKLRRHGDAGVALACLVAASSAPTTPLKYTPVPRSRGHFALKGLI